MLRVFLFLHFPISSSLRNPWKWSVCPFSTFWKSFSDPLSLYLHIDGVPGWPLPTDTQDVLGWWTWARLVPGRANSGVKLPPISWDPGRGAGPLCTSVFLPEKWGDEICNLRSLWGPHCMSLTEEPGVDLVRGSLRGHFQMSMGHWSVFPSCPSLHASQLEGLWSQVEKQALRRPRRSCWTLPRGCC